MWLPISVSMMNETDKAELIERIKAIPARDIYEAEFEWDTPSCWPVFSSRYPDLGVIGRQTSGSRTGKVTIRYSLSDFKGG